MSTTYESGDVYGTPGPAATPPAGEYDTTTGRVFTVTGGDWDTITLDPSQEESRIVVNMGPQHPSTHGVLRLILELDGETVTEARAGIGYLHTGIEKTCEYRTWVQGVTLVTRMDYLAPFFNETAYCLGVEKLLGITDRIYTVFEGRVTDNLPSSEATPEALMRSMTSLNQKATA